MHRSIYVIAGLAMSCGTSVSFIPLNEPPGPRASKPPEAVEVLTAGPPNRPYVEVGLLEARQDSAYSLDGSARIIAEMRERAAELGCDALVVTGSSDIVQPDFLSDTVDTLRGYRGTCIVYTRSVSSDPRAAQAER